MGGKQGEIKWDEGPRMMEKTLKDYNRSIQFHVHEFYSPERVNRIARLMGAVPVMSFDLTTHDPDDGRPWDFNDPEKRSKAEEIIRTKRCLLLVGSPMCAAFSQLQNINFAKMTKGEVEKVILLI